MKRKKIKTLIIALLSFYAIIEVAKALEDQKVKVQHIEYAEKLYSDHNINGDIKYV